jgi:hypothetical protein
VFPRTREGVPQVHDQHGILDKAIPLPARMLSPA